MDALDPRHGTPAGAMQHWRDSEDYCGPCSRAASAARKRRELDALAGKSRTVELGEDAWRIVRDNPRIVIANTTGWTIERVIRYDKGGPTMRVHRKTRDAILACRPQWTVVGIHRRVRALSRLGWSIAAQHRHSGVSLKSLYGIRGKVPAFVRAYTAQRIVAMYDELSMKTPPPGASRRETLAEAIRQGFDPPLAWSNIDDPLERPHRATTRNTVARRDEVDEAVVYRVIRGERLDMTPAERRAVVAVLRDQRGWSENQIEQHTGISKATDTNRYPREETAA